MTEASSGGILPRYSWVADYLREIEQWQLLGEGQQGSLWESPVGDFVVPRALDGDPDLAVSVINRISAVVGRPNAETRDDIVFGSADIIDLRVDGPTVGRGWISFELAAAVLVKSYAAFRAAATTAFGPKPEIHRYSVLGDEVVESAQMAHTRDGSFIFPIIVRLPRRRADDQQSVAGIREAELTEPKERRVTRTFAEALGALGELLPSASDDSLNARSLPELVRAGASRQFCLALARLLSDAHVERVTADFRWAKNGPPSSTLPKRTHLTKLQVDGLKSAANLLRNASDPSLDLYTGKIVSMSAGEVASDPHYLRLQTVRRCRLVMIDIRVDGQTHDDAEPWYLSGQTVSVRGKIRRQSNGWVMDSPVGLSPLDLQNLLLESQTSGIR